MTPWKSLLKNLKIYVKTLFGYKQKMSQIIHDSFIVFLVFYLILFLLESLFPGIISNNFQLNILLVPLFILGIISAFFSLPMPREKQKTNLDYITVAFLTIITFIIILNGTNSLGNISIILASISSFLVFWISLLALFSEGENREKTRFQIQWELLNTKLQSYYRNIVFKKITIPLPAIFTTIIIFGLLLVARTVNIPEKQIFPLPSQNKTYQKIYPVSNVSNQLQKTSIELENGGIDILTFTSIGGYLQQNNIYITNTKFADKNGYKGIIVKYNIKDKQVATYIANKMKYIYSHITQIPTQTQPETTIHIIIGNLQ